MFGVLRTCHSAISTAADSRLFRPSLLARQNAMICSVSCSDSVQYSIGTSCGRTGLTSEGARRDGGSS